MRVFITAATIGEWMQAFLEIEKVVAIESKAFRITFHKSGVGLLATAVSLTRLVYTEKPDLVVQVGIAGSFNSNLSLGKVVAVKEEILGDMGVEENHKWEDIFDLKLEKPSSHPYKKKGLPNDFIKKFNLLELDEVIGITVNEISTRQERIQQIINKYNPTLESMEGAALHFICREANIPFLQIRAISNFVGERDKKNWKIKEAIYNLNQIVLKYIHKLQEINLNVSVNIT